MKYVNHNAKEPINIKNAGSTSIEYKASRLAPIPSKLLPVSSAEMIIRNLPNASTYANITKSPSNEMMPG